MPSRRGRLQFSLRWLFIVIALVAVTVASLSGLLRPGPTWSFVDGLSDDLARGMLGKNASGEIVEPIATTMHVERDPAEVKLYLMLSVLGPVGVLVVLGFILRARQMWSAFWRLWGW